MDPLSPRASGNAVAHDEVVGPPRHIQWIAEPRHTRSHEHIPSIYALVSTGGRIFYIADEASIGSIRQTPKWYLEARDAFNGIGLWKKPIETWFPHIVNWGQTPPQLERKLVAVGNRVYVTLGLFAPLSALDAATGQTLKVYSNTEGAEEIILHKGTLLAVVRSVTEGRIAESKKWAQLVKAKDSPVYVRETAEPLVKRLRAVEAGGAKTLLALDADTGRLLWKKDGAVLSGLRAGSLCADADRVFYQNGKDVVCLDFETGRELWSVSAGPLRVVYNGSVFCSDGETVTALSADNGQTRWTQPTSLTEIRDAFVAGGALAGGFKRSREKGPSWGLGFATQCELHGKMLMHIEPENPGHHHRCYSNKATDRYILGGRRGTEFIDLATGDVLWNSWARGVCRYGVMPCNGLLYTPPFAVKSGFHALRAGSQSKSKPLKIPLRPRGDG
jgi:outer membrane protein assembly factor BamB